jgi:hypothetical protein
MLMSPEMVSVQENTRALLGRSLQLLATPKSSWHCQANFHILGLLFSFSEEAKRGVGRISVFW